MIENIKESVAHYHPLMNVDRCRASNIGKIYCSIHSGSKTYMAAKENILA